MPRDCFLVVRCSGLRLGSLSIDESWWAWDICLGQQTSLE